jgi:hypothetical protein
MRAGVAFKLHDEGELRFLQSRCYGGIPLLLVPDLCPMSTSVPKSTPSPFVSKLRHT